MAEGHSSPLHLPDGVEHAGFDPLPPDAEHPPERRWWGNHVRELRWQAELARLLVDPVWRGVGVPRGDGSHVLLIPGFLAGDESLGILASWLKRVGYRRSYRVIGERLASEAARAREATEFASTSR